MSPLQLNLPENIKVMVDELIDLSERGKKFEKSSEDFSNIRNEINSKYKFLLDKLMETYPANDSPNAQDDCKRIIREPSSVVFDELCDEAKIIAIARFLLSYHRLPVKAGELNDNFIERYKKLILDA